MARVGLVRACKGVLERRFLDDNASAKPDEGEGEAHCHTQPVAQGQSYAGDAQDTPGVGGMTYQPIWPRVDEVVIGLDRDNGAEEAPERADRPHAQANAGPHQEDPDE